MTDKTFTTSEGHKWTLLVTCPCCGNKHEIERTGYLWTCPDCNVSYLIPDIERWGKE